MTEGDCEAGRFYSNARKTFDRWFYSHDKGTQEEMRRKGILPYREMKVNDYVFPVNTESQKAVIKPIIDPTDSNDEETFYSRDRVAEFTRRLLDTLAYSHSPEVRLHFQLIKLALRDAGAMTNEQLARLNGMTRAGINFRVQHIRGILAGEKLSDENDNRQKGEASGIRLRKVQSVLPKNKGKKVGLPKNPSSKAHRKIQGIQKGLERQK